jgi:disulfide bond formation protein DsbB
MQSFLPIINKVLALGVVLSQVFVLLVIALIISKGKSKLLDFISKYVLQIVFLISLSGVFVSLYYSDVIGFAPCILCWLQRIFMYPLVPLTVMAIWKKDRGIIDYSILLSVIGLLIAVYHNVIYYFNIEAGPCGATGISCIQHFVSELGGFVSIPMMSLAGFTLILTCLISAKIRKHA